MYLLFFNSTEQFCYNVNMSIPSITEADIFLTSARIP